MSDEILDALPDPWPRVDQFMSDADLASAAERIKRSIDWSRLPKLAAIFEHRPSVNRYWRELVALSLLSLEVNSGALNKRNAEAQALATVTAERDQGKARAIELQAEPAAMAARMIEIDELREHFELGCAIAAAFLELQLAASGGAPSNPDWGSWLKKERERLEEQS